MIMMVSCSCDAGVEKRTAVVEDDDVVSMTVGGIPLVFNYIQEPSESSFWLLVLLLSLVLWSGICFRNAVNVACCCFCVKR